MAASPATAHALPLRVANPRAYAAAKAAAERRHRELPAHGPQAQAPTATRPSSPTASASPTLLTAVFGGLNEDGIAGGGAYTPFTPPDSTGAIGPNYYIEMVNSQIAVYSRTSLSSPVATESETTFSKRANACGDGQIRWDQQGQRWEYALLECSENHTEEGLAFGWSKTADPTSLTTGWCKYHKETGSTLEDYPKLGGDNEFLLIGANGFEEVQPGKERFIGASLFAIPMPALGESTCPTRSSSVAATERISMPTWVFTPVPANIYGPSATGYVVVAEYPEPSPGKNIGLFTVTSLLGVPTIHENVVPVKSYMIPPNIPQPGTTDELDSSDSRLTQAVAAEDPTQKNHMAVWTQHTVAAAEGKPSIVRWYELDASSSSLVQEGTVEAPVGSYAFNGAISPTTGGGAAIDYNVGGPETLVQLRAQSRTSSMPPGTMTGEIALAHSLAIDQDITCPSASQEELACRWGDYAGASPDPENAENAWGSGQVNGPLPAKPHAPQWRTENFALTATTPAGTPPVASFAASTSTPSPGEQIDFDGSTSHASAGIVFYEWSFGDGSVPEASASASAATHTYRAPGKFLVTLTVTDSNGLTAKAEREIAVDAPPTAAFAVGSATPTAATPVGFDSSASTDTDGSISNYAWSFGDGGTAGGAAPSHTYATPGQYAVTLTVTDNGGKTASVTHVLGVADAPPTAAFSTTTPSPTAGTPVGFNGGGSADADGSVAGYSWSFGDGTSGSGPTPSNVYTKAGTYTVKLTVTDNGGLSASTEQTIAVGPEPNVFAVVAVKPNKRNGSVALSVRLPGPGLFTAVDAASAGRAKATSKASLLIRLAHILGFADPSAEAAKKGKSKHKPKRTPAFVKPARLAVAGAGTVPIQMLLTSAGKAELVRHRGKLTVKLLLTFAPTYGSPASKTQVIRPAIVKPRGKKRK